MSFHPFPIPPRAITIWTDNLSLYCSLPGPDGPTIVRYPLTTAGLSSALGIIRTKSYDSAAGPHTTTPSRPRRPSAQHEVEGLEIMRKFKLIG